MVAAVSFTSSSCRQRFFSTVVLVLVLLMWLSLESSSSLHVVAATSAASINTVEEESPQQHQSHRQLDSAFTKPPTDPPTPQPTPAPTRQPVTPTKQPTKRPTRRPSNRPTRQPVQPTPQPTKRPSRPPTPRPTKTPTTTRPTPPPTPSPTWAPTATNFPTFSPTTLSPTRAPTPRPTKAPRTSRPTPPPTPRPTWAPTATNFPTLFPTTMSPTLSGAPQCGAFRTEGAQLLLGPYATSQDGELQTSQTVKSFACNDGTGNWFAKSYYTPSFLYSFKLTQQCEYMYRDPTNPYSVQDVKVRDVNSWFTTAAVKFQRLDNTGYKVSPDNIGFTGWDVPSYQNDLYKTSQAGMDSSWCPESYCVKITGNAIGRIENNYDVEASVSPSSSPSTDTRRQLNRNQNNVVVDEDEVVWSLDKKSDQYLHIIGQAALDTVSEDPSATGFSQVFEKYAEVQVSTKNGGWGSDFYLPDPNSVPTGTKILFWCDSTWSMTIHYNKNTQSKRLQKYGRTSERKLLLIALDDTFDAGRKRWFVEDDYISNTDKYIMHANEDDNDHEDYVQYGCTSYYNTGFSYRARDSSIKNFNPDHCNKECANRGYEFFGYECPMGWSSKVHCQCYASTENDVEDMNCKELVGVDGDKHCTGPAMVDGISLGGADIGSIYKIKTNNRAPNIQIENTADAASPMLMTPGDVNENELIYAFSHKDAAQDFYKMLYDTMKSNNSKQIYLTNHFLKCGCESFCLDDEPDEENDNQPQATCYVEEVCGESVYKISYSDYFPAEMKPDWAEIGTTDVMDWFSACAYGQYQCKVHPNSDFKMFEGIPTSSGKKNKFPNEYRYNKYEDYPEVYGLGGHAKEGFPTATSGAPHIMWTCPSRTQRDDLHRFGKIIKETSYMRGDYKKPTQHVPKVPCPPEIMDPPSEPELPPPIGPNCTDVDHAGYCIQLPGGTCFIREPIKNCIELDFVIETTANEDRIDGESIRVYSNVQEWVVACIEISTDCSYWAASTGELTFKGGPKAEASVSDENGWMFTLSNRVVNNKNTMIDGEMYFDCSSWESAYGAKNFTDGAADRYGVFGNTYGDLFTVEDTTEECTNAPSEHPTSAPSLSSQPSYVPTMSPTVCHESYLDSDNLNIALVVDLSFSTYEKTFSSDIDIGDVNGDGKGNTILDAQVVAIQDLLISIAESDNLNNTNTEIELISFETDAISHGVWKPLNEKLRGAGDSFNSELMDFIKTELRAPIRNDDVDEVFDLNNGYTNFDSALDRTVEYFENKATKNRLNLMVFMSDGEPNVRGDGDEEMYCSDTTLFWNGDDTLLECSDLGLKPGEPHKICRGNDRECVENEPYQDCVRGPNHCFNSDAVQQYDSELHALDDMKVARLAIGVGDESNVSSGSALWMIDDNPGKDLGILPEQVLTLEELSSALKHLCILNTDPPTASPSTSPSASPTTSPVPSNSPSQKPSSKPSDVPSMSPTDVPEFVMVTKTPTSSPSNNPTGTPTKSPTNVPSKNPSAGPTVDPTVSPSDSPTSNPSDSPTAIPTPLPSVSPSMSPTTVSPTKGPSTAPSGSFFPSSAPSPVPTKSPAPSNTPTSTPSHNPTGGPTISPSSAPSGQPSSKPSSSPTKGPSDAPTSSPSISPSFPPSTSPSSSPTESPTISSAPSFLLPDCYDGPKLITKDSSDISMCYYNPDMIQINDMNSTDVTIAINNVWTADVLPEQLQVFIHANGVESIRPNGDGFQCMDDDGNDVDVEGDNELTVECYQEEPGVAGSPFLAIIDVVIMDRVISTGAAHPCFPDELISEACSWRIIVPCDYEELCTEEPSSSPSASPSASPSESPSDAPTTGPSSSPSSIPFESPSTAPSVVPTSSPTSSPTSAPVKTSSPTSAPVKSPVEDAITQSPVSPPITVHGDDDDDDIVFNPECPDDILLINQIGVTPFPNDGIRILSQDQASVTVELTQSYTTSPSTIDYLFYQYKPDSFDTKCYEEDNMDGAATIEVTIECMRNTPIALLELWVADAVEKNVLTADDTAIIPDCCHPSVPEGTPTTKYLFEIKCETACPEVIE